LRGMKEFVPFISAGILLIVVYVMPEGLVSLFKLIHSRVIKRPKKESLVHAP